MDEVTRLLALKSLWLTEIASQEGGRVASIAVIVSLLKQDFTGQSFDPIDLIRIKINDLNKISEARYRDEIRKIKE